MNSDSQFITLFSLMSQRFPTMLDQNGKDKERVHETKAEKKIEEIRAEVEKILERLEQIEVEEPRTKTWHTQRK